MEKVFFEEQTILYWEGCQPEMNYDAKFVEIESKEDLLKVLTDYQKNDLGPAEYTYERFYNGLIVIKCKYYETEDTPRSCLVGVYCCDYLSWESIIEGWWKEGEVLHFDNDGLVK